MATKNAEKISSILKTHHKTTKNNFKKKMLKIGKKEIKTKTMDQPDFSQTAENHKDGFDGRMNENHK